MDQVFLTIKQYLRAPYPEYLVEIFLIWLVIYAFLRFMECTSGEGILKGIALLILTVPILVNILAEQFKVIDRLVVIMNFFGAAAIPALVVLVQRELRRVLGYMKHTRFFGILFKG